MIARAASIGLALVVAFALAGCVSSRQMPPGPTQEEIAADVQQQVDLAWKNTGLEGTVDRPATSTPQEFSTMQGLSECLVAGGIDSWGLGSGPDGPTFSIFDAEGVERSDIDSQLLFYTCFAQSPMPSVESGFGLTRDQRDFLYDYYQRWVLPCLAVNDITVSVVPTRVQYLSTNFVGWNPYSSASSIRSADEHEAAIRLCGDPYPGIEVREFEWWMG